MTAPLVIVGTGLAGYGLARELRKLDKTRPVMLITQDDGASYSKPMLSTGFAKGTDADGLVMATAADMADQLGVVVRTLTRVTHLDPARRQLTLDTGEAVEWSSLVLATGASPVRLPVEADAPDHVFHINSLTDYRHFRQGLPSGGRVLIMGAGLIGCELANDLRAGGYDVDLVAPCDAPLPGLVPTEAGRVLQEALEDAGVVFHLNRVVERLTPQGSRVDVELSNGARLTADRIISAVGLKPDLTLARQARLAVNRGIVVDSCLRTSAPGIYALGDCAEVDGQVRLYVQPLMVSARALAKTLTGQPTAVQFGPMPVVVKTPACPVVSAPPEDPDGHWVVESRGPRSLVCRFEDALGRLKGFALTGEAVSEKMVLTRALTARD